MFLQAPSEIYLGRGLLTFITSFVYFLCYIYNMQNLQKKMPAFSAGILLSSYRFVDFSFFLPK